VVYVTIQWDGGGGGGPRVVYRHGYVVDLIGRSIKVCLCITFGVTDGLGNLT